MKAPDTSVLIAALVSWHESHDVAREAIRGSRLIAHTQFEMLSVLTRLPEPNRVDGALVAEFLALVFPAPPLALTGAALRRAPVKLAESGVLGGAVYDGLVALTALAHGATLVSLDKRAETTYARLGVSVEMLPSV